MRADPTFTEEPNSTSEQCAPDTKPSPSEPTSTPTTSDEYLPFEIRRLIAIPSHMHLRANTSLLAPSPRDIDGRTGLI